MAFISSVSSRSLEPFPSRLLSKGLISRSFGRVDRHGMRPSRRFAAWVVAVFLLRRRMGTRRHRPQRKTRTARRDGREAGNTQLAGGPCSSRRGGRQNTSREVAVYTPANPLRRGGRRTRSGEVDGGPLPEAVEVGRREVVSRRLPAQ